MNWYLEVWKKYAQFSGRARRKEYWMYTLFNMLICLGIIVMGSYLDPDFGGVVALIYIVYCLASLIPSLAVSVRRLHDTNHSGWALLWNVLPILGPIIVLVLMVRDSDPGKNDYGPNPKGVGEPWDDQADFHDYQGQRPKVAMQPWDDEIV